MRDRKWINLNEYYDIEYWAEKFSVSPEVLRQAVKNSGSNLAEEVELYIKNTYKLK